MTLPNTVYEMSKNFVLDKFPVFCDRMYPKCDNTDFDVIKAKFLPYFDEQNAGAIQKGLSLIAQLVIILVSTVLFY